jgi:hypothetical protein
MEVAMRISKQFARASLLLPGVAFANIALADDNCADVKSALMKDPAVVVVGDNCQHLGPGPVLLDLGANVDGLAQCGKVADKGGLPGNAFINCAWGNACWGSRAVANWDGGPGQVKPTTPKPDTYVGYCASDKASAPVDPAKVGALKKQIEEMKIQLKK